MALAGIEGSGAGAGLGRPDAIVLERPPKAEFGDYATNAALLLAPSLGSPPREVAERLGVELGRRLGARLARFEVAGPGFLNLFLDDSWLRGALTRVLTEDAAFGAGGAQASERILSSSSRPTPPGRCTWATRVTPPTETRWPESSPFTGTRSNASSTSTTPARRCARWASRSARSPAEGRSPRAAITATTSASSRRKSTAPRLSTPPSWGAWRSAMMIARMQSTLGSFAVQGFDHWQYESALHAGDPSPVAHTLQTLEEHGHTYREDGALWLRTTDYGDDKDRVLVRSSGEHTYFASDIAYHQDKRERGFERQIDVWGADHHGYLPRMRAAYAALGGDPAHLEMLTMQLVHLVRRGERAQMSKRAGEFVTLDDLVSEVGVDAARWFLLSRSHDTTIDLDLDLARAQSRENPVYYVQYAHARIVSVLALAGPERVARALEDATRADADPGEGADVGEGWEETLHPAERALIKRLLAFPGEIAETAQRRAPHRIAAYALELAQDYTSFYDACRIVDDAGGSPEEGALNRCGWRCRWRLSVRSQAAWICSGSRRPSGCSCPLGAAARPVSLRPAVRLGSAVEARQIGVQTRPLRRAERRRGR